ncbi:hypothetical protein [Flavobacterium sp. '19STA2R22 D10 B1']|uniref:hypothetical protein n=1 Tax=Flavobacterium aerium TaxID=3037261 RepID=UPI00278C109D|nr:hypothetical protein [Flavobacterium sp. '19STA2R22 D10 B1']
MKKINILCIAISVLSLTSCKKDQEKPKVIYEDSTKTITAVNNVKIDSSQIKIADLPINMEGTKYLIYPIGDVRLYEGRSKKVFGSSSDYNAPVSFSISNYNRFELTGFLHDLKFQHVDSTKIRSLSNELPILIQTATFLNTISDKSKRQILVYSIVDKDTNRDGKLNANDVKSLYISDISGLKFTKLSPEYHELIDWNVIEATNRLYFRTIEDTNKNGEFDKNDLVHYHYVDLGDKQWKIEKYDPLENVE